MARGLPASMAWHVRRRLLRLRDAGSRWRFRRERADYYDYLAAVLTGAGGRRTLKDVFREDARRHGRATLRGRLSERWLHTYQRAGGDLYATWRHDIPHAELALVRAAQTLGNEAVVRTFEELAKVLALTHRTSRMVQSLLWPAGFAVLIAMTVALLVPGLTVPRLLQTFADVPPESYGPLTRRLLSFSDAVARYAPFVLVTTVGATAWLVWSLPNRPGRWRHVLDDYLWWDAYRCVAALRFLAMLHIALGDHEQSVTRLRTALLLQRQGATPWLTAHIDAMLARLDHGVSDPSVFDTGLLPKVQYWFFADMMVARGLRQGLRLATRRLRGHVLGGVARRAAMWRWLLLLSSVGAVLSLLAWHYAVIDELRRALTFHFAA